MNIVGLCCLKDSARLVERVLASHLAICDRVLLLDDGSTDRTGEIAKRFQRVTYFRQDGLVRNEARDRNWLFDKVHAIHPAPDWIWWFDGDETVLGGTRAMIESVPTAALTVTTPLLSVWGRSGTLVRADWSVEKHHLFRYVPDLCRGYHWIGTPPYGLHCGSRPRLPQYEASRAHLPGLVELHWAWMDPEDVAARLDRYRAQDPRFPGFKPYRKYEGDIAPPDGAVFGVELMSPSDLAQSVYAWKEANR